MICHSLNAISLRKVTLSEYVEIVSFATSMPIYIDKDIDALKINLFMPRDIDKFLLLETLDSTLRDNDLFLKKLKDIYIIKKLVPQKYYSYKFRYINPKDINATLSIFDNMKYSYLPFTNTLVFNTDETTFNKALSILKLIDIKQVQKKIKLTIFTTNINKLLEYGSQTDGLTIDLNNFANSVFSTTTSSTTYNSTNSISFKATLTALANNGVSEIKQSPTITLRDGELSKVSFVENIPYQVSTTSVTDGTSTTQQTTEYKDVGLKISVTPKIFDTYTFLAFDFVNETILTSGDKPTTQKISYNSKFELKKDEVLIISGLTKSETYNETQKIPLLGDLPLLEYLFKYKNETNSSTIISIMVEHINE